MRIVVYGAGYWGMNYIRELGAHVVQVVEPDTDRAEYVYQKFSVRVVSEFRDTEHEAVIICTPPDTHVDLALPHLEAGKLALIEKPMAHSVEDAERLRPYANQIMAGLVYLYHPAVYYEMPNWLVNNEIDHVYARRSNCGPVRPWADAMWDLAPHEASIFNHLFGTHGCASAVGTRDWAQLAIGYGSMNAVIYVSWLGHRKVRTIELVPPAGVDAGYTFDDMTWSMEVSPLRRMLDAFLSGSWDRCHYDAGLEVVRVLEEAHNFMLVA